MNRYPGRDCEAPREGTSRGAGRVDAGGFRSAEGVGIVAVDSAAGAMAVSAGDGVYF